MSILSILLDITQGTEVATSAMGANLLTGIGIGGAGGGVGGMAYVKYQLKLQAESTAKQIADFAAHQSNHVDPEDVKELKKAFMRHTEKHEKDDREIFTFISSVSAKMDSIDDFMHRIEKKL